jgi:putative PLP-dependent aminotransferase (TIGR04422 family)
MSVEFAGRIRRAHDIEARLREMFVGGHPILCSSGRAAIVLALLAMEVQRNERVGTFPYASHCVLDAVGRVATPAPASTLELNSPRICYHQWGYVQETGLGHNVIEDCVDTLVAEGARLFPGGASTEIWSLPKILGVSSGGVLWVRDPSVAELVRRLRDQRGGGILQWGLRLLGTHNALLHAWWQGGETLSGSTSKLQNAEIDIALDGWSQIVERRRRLAKLAEELLPSWLPLRQDRLPSVIAHIAPSCADDIAGALGFLAGCRHMERFEVGTGKRSIVRMLPVPIHQDITEERLLNAVRAVSGVIEQSRGVQ